MTAEFFTDPQFLAPPRVERHDLGGGAFLLRSPEPLGPYARCIGDWLEHWAVATPEAVALAERDARGEWRRLSYRELRMAVGRIGQALLDLQLPADAPITVLSDNLQASQRCTTEPDKPRCGPCVARGPHRGIPGSRSAVPRSLRLGLSLWSG